MSCTKCKTDICKCGKSALPVMPPSGCNTPDCASPEPCSEVVSMACIQFIGENKECQGDVVYQLGDNIQEIQSKIVDYFCSKVSSVSTIPTDILCGLDTVYTSGDSLIDALEKVTTYFCSKATTMTTLPADITCGVDTVCLEGDDLITALGKVVSYFCTQVADSTTIPSDVLCGLDTVYNEDDTVIEALGKLTTYICNRFSNLDTNVYNEVTHAELVTLIGTSTLQPGESYKITDFQTIYPQPDYSDPTTPKAEINWTIKTAGIEELVVLATSNNTISKEAWSIDFPHDVIEYDYRVETYKSIPTKGKITRRRDAVGNDVPFDFRNVKFKRYETTPFSGVFDAYWDTANASDELYVFTGYNPLTPGSYQSQYQNNRINLSENTPQGSLDASMFNIWAFNTIFYEEAYSNIFNGTINNNTVNKAVYNVFEGLVYNLRNTGILADNRFQGEFNDVLFLGAETIQNSFNSVLITECIFVNFSSNTGNGTISNINAMDTLYFKNNIIQGGDNFANITIQGGAEVLNNKFLSTSIKGTNPLAPMIWGTPFTNNVINNAMINTHVGNGFKNNTINADFSNMVNIGNNFQRNKIEAEVDYSTDFSNPLAHVYQIYNCEIFTRQDGTQRLRYTDNTDAIVVTNVNA